MGELKVYSFIGKKRNGYDTNEYISGTEFANALAKADAESDGEIKVSINSGGGSVTDGWAMISAMQKCKNEVVATIDGYAASMGYYICLGAKKITAAQNSIIMLHSVQGGASGSPEDLRKEAEILDKFNEAMSTLLVARTGLSKDQVIEQFLGKELWLTAAEALDLKLIDAIENYDAENIPEVTAEMTFEQAEFKYAALHQCTHRNSLINEVVDRVKAFFEKPAAEPQRTAQLTEKEVECLGSLLWTARYLADESGHYTEYTANTEIKTMLEDMRKASSAWVVGITGKLYGEDNADGESLADALVQKITAEKQNEKIAQAQKAAADYVKAELDKADEAVKVAQQTITELQAENAKLKASPAASGSRVVNVIETDGTRPLSKAELEAKFGA